MGELLRVAIDAGGSHTRVLIDPPDSAREEWLLPSINWSACGAEADDVLSKLFCQLRDRIRGDHAVGWLASASAETDQINPELSRLRLFAERSGLHLPLLLSNDLLPLLWGTPCLENGGVVVVSGTGSAIWGKNEANQIARAGGCEYLGSDEGSAFSLGQAGLRAAVRALDGRGPATKLTETLVSASGDSVPALARRLANQAFPKQPVAQLAPIVCETWTAGDPVAAELVHSALSELIHGVKVVAERLDLPSGFPVASVGGVFEGCPELHSELCLRLKSELGVGLTEGVTETSKTILHALTRLSDQSHTLQLPPSLKNRYAWRIDSERN